MRLGEIDCMRAHTNPNLSLKGTGKLPLNSINTINLDTDKKRETVEDYILMRPKIPGSNSYYESFYFYLKKKNSMMWLMAQIRSLPMVECTSIMQMWGLENIASLLQVITWSKQYSSKSKYKYCL